MHHDKIPMSKDGTGQDDRESHDESFLAIEYVGNALTLVRRLCGMIGVPQCGQ